MTESNALRKLNAAGQSVWYDNIQRSMLDGELATMIERDDNIPPLAELLAELDYARRIVQPLLPEPA